MFDYIPTVLRSQEIIDKSFHKASNIVEPYFPKKEDKIERAKGYVNYITMLLYRADINIVHLISVYNDTTIILENRDLTDAFKIISSKIME